MASAACTPSLFAADRALIMTISDYQRAPALPGVKFDAVNAQKILSGLGFSSDHLRTLDERQLTLAGMRQALSQLAQEISDGDRVFVYYSGHGMSYPIGDRCEQALVSQDMRPLARSPHSGRGPSIPSQRSIGRAPATPNSAPHQST
jgi:uncharacterized caspase-like protein